MLESRDRAWGARLLRTARGAPTSYGAPSLLVLALAVIGCGSGRGSEGPPAEERASNPGCIDCHIDDYQGAHRHANVKPKRCEACHREDHWHPVVKKHEWPLTGAHEKADCLSCHASKPPVYEGLSRACISCHRAEFEAQNAKSPSHASSSEVCDKCHSTNEWSEWPGHPKGAETPPVATPAVEPPKPTATAAASTSKPVTPRKPTPKPRPTATATGTPAPTTTATVVPTTTIPPIVTGASRRH